LELFLFNRLFHLLIKKGKKAKALNVFLKVIQGLKETKIVETENLRPIQIIYQGLNNIKPLLSVT
jgi:ribosomal protein S7